jgi:hypothetical protein
MAQSKRARERGACKTKAWKSHSIIMSGAAAIIGYNIRQYTSYEIDTRVIFVLAFALELEARVVPNRRKVKLRVNKWK